MYTHIYVYVFMYLYTHIHLHTHIYDTEKDHSSLAVLSKTWYPLIRVKSDTKVLKYLGKIERRMYF